MDWYEKLKNYFPDEELKHPGQFEELLQKSPAYHKFETPEVIVMYADFPTFLFIDYFLVTSKERGRGVGSKVLNAFKKRGKPIILEVEPADDDDPDTVRRVHFYEKNGFRKAEHIVYTRRDDDGEEFSMDVWYWHEAFISEREVLSNMAVICREIHNFKAQKYYGRLIATPDEVLDWDS
ncbi:GNAT family N-acetyltransferase [Alicyclobacillus acidiphilus]|uniref:GNAT family N-acetyltransferase n=1 Tax=Alicyclobacillus acidiphilus TaxID=182455 RepID=UPI00082E565D|nr:GNAT family N-acetyltransferase [Alicyclobacillus acidiphilus]